MKRIMMIGAPSSGKSTLAKRFDFLKWAWTPNKVYAAKYRVALAMLAPHAHVLRLGSRREAETFIQILSR
jgi:hypothetical protein